LLLVETQSDDVVEDTTTTEAPAEEAEAADALHKKKSHLLHLTVYLS